MDENKLVTYKNLQIGQEIKGHRLEGSMCFYTATVKDINSSYVTILKFEKFEERVDARSLFEVRMTKQEFEEKYKEKAKEVLSDIKNKLNHDEIGYHEMWNAWLYGTPGTPYTIAQQCIKHKIKVLGHCTDITPKTAMFSGDTLDVGICAEDEDGERFWCHFRYSDIERMLEEYKELLI